MESEDFGQRQHSVSKQEAGTGGGGGGGGLIGAHHAPGHAQTQNALS